MAKWSGFSLADVAVRPVRDATERAQWDRLMDHHHYLGFRGMLGASLRHVAETPDGRWLALIGWCADAFNVGARDRWIGWASEQQFRRLRLITNNTRFLILPQARVANLASRVLSLSLRRLSDDMQSRYGFTVQPSGVAGGDLRRPVALCGRLLPGVELAGVGRDAGLRALGGWLGGARRAAADLGVPADRQYAG